MGVAVGPPAAFAALAAAGVTAMTGGAFAGVAVAAWPQAAVWRRSAACWPSACTDDVAADFQQQVERGGILLWTSLRGPEQEARALEFLRRHAAGDIHVHEIPA